MWHLGSHLTRGAWIEISNKGASTCTSLGSHLTRGAWIEIAFRRRSEILPVVAPHTRCVD